MENSTGSSDQPQQDFASKPTEPSTPPTNGKAPGRPRGRTGPKTTSGKSHLRHNALRHGLTADAIVIPSAERTQDWDAHRAGVRKYCAPQGYLEIALVNRLAELLWRLRRVAPYETSAIAAARRRGDEEYAKQLRKSLALKDDDRYRQVKKTEDLMHGLGLLARRLKDNASDDVPVPAEVARQYLSMAAGRAKVVLDTLDTLEMPGVPTGDFWLFFGWTVRNVRDGVSAIATHAKLDPAELLRLTREDILIYVTLVQSAPQEMARAVLEDERKQAVEAHGLPDAETLDRLVRYEAHLQKQLIQTLHELEALQARRRGQRTYLARVDVSGLPEP
jgi:hypothetical protein